MAKKTDSLYQIKQTNTLPCSTRNYLQLLSFKNNLILPQVDGNMIKWKPALTETLVQQQYFGQLLGIVNPIWKNMVTLERILKYQLY
jgi:hypothetical protein